MASISGQTTSKISGVDGFFTTSGGGITGNTMPAAGVTGNVMVGNSGVLSNPDVTADFRIGATQAARFTKIESGQSGDSSTLSQVAITSSGELWYNYQPNVIWKSWATADGTWRQYGVATDWDDISMDPDGNCVMAIRGGDLWFVGYGANGQRGDGSTLSAGSWIMVNNSLVWLKVNVGSYYSGAIDSNSHVYLSGRNYNYMTAQGTTSGTTITFTRDKNNLTAVDYVFCGPYRTTLFVVSGNIYSSGRNQNYIGGGLLASTGDQDGPNLGYSGGDIVSVSCNYWCAMAITTTGQLRFAGQANYRPRPDGSNSNHSTSALSYNLIDGGATGYTFYQYGGKTSDGNYPALAIKNGQLSMGGGSYGYGVKVGLGYPSNNSWVNVGNTTATCAVGTQFLITVSW